MNKQTLEKMHQMKLYGMHRAFTTVLENNTDQDLSSDQIITQLVDAEHDDRNNRRIERLIKNAKFRYKAAVEEVHYNSDRNLQQIQVSRLAECSFIEKSENIFITGSTGVGKSYLACALGQQACILGHRTLYAAASRLLSHLKMAKADGTYVRETRKIQRHKLLILDDMGLQPIDREASHILLEVIEDRYNIGSTIFTSQIPVENWYELMAESTIADAIMDRIVHQSHRIQIDGESMRKKQAKLN
jgi:DNA replication protein DnaC